jgi:YD repeat-containing protein
MAGQAKEVQVPAQSGSDNAQSHLPVVTLDGGAVQRHDIQIHGKHGHTDIVTGVSPQSGETAAQFLHRLHPDLSADQLQKEVIHLVKYNRDYGNNIAADSPLDPSKPVYLCSIKTQDSSGRITKIESPTGRTIDIKYDDAGKIAAYQLTDANGHISEQVNKDAGGNYTLVNDKGQSQSLTSVSIDQNGDIVLSDTQGNTLGHLTRGDDVVTELQNGKPSTSTVVREGQIISAYHYEYSETGTSIYATEADAPGNTVLLDKQDNAEEFARLAAGEGYERQGQTPQVSAPEAASAGSSESASERTTSDSSSNYKSIQGETETDKKVKQSAFATLNNSATPKKCGWAVQDAWEHAGYPELDYKGDGWSMHNYLDTSANFVSVDRATALAAVRAGHVAIVCRRWTEEVNKEEGGCDSGHAETLMADANGTVMGVSFFEEAYDPNNPRYDGSQDRFYLPKEDVQSR